VDSEEKITVRENIQTLLVWPVWSSLEGVVGSPSLDASPYIWQLPMRIF
jgi:hypothetical protein